MKKDNRTIFDELPESDYFKSHKKAVKKFRNVVAFPDALGFDQDMGGFIALHRMHVDIALPEELPGCLILKKLGFCLVLLGEESGHASVDLLIGETYFEIKRVSKARNIQNAIIWQMRFAKRKADNLILHVDQVAHPESVRRAIYRGIKKYSRIRLVWLIYEGQFWQLSRAMILEGKFLLK